LARPQAGRNQRRFFFLLGDGGDVRTLLQKRVICFALFFIMVAAWRRPSIVARLRAEPAAALAPLNHMLKKGFFLIHGFFICDFSNLIVSCPRRNSVRQPTVISIQSKFIGGQLTY
ncbi:MAG TPA: hypothetical protein VHK27_04495, partial [Gammaproteobacteria bacterium]|nr:hypothetical protein [Gammaproteobacteria bacterium]